MFERKMNAWFSMCFSSLVTLNEVKIEWINEKHVSFLFWSNWTQIPRIWFKHYSYHITILVKINESVNELSRKKDKKRPKTKLRNTSRSVVGKERFRSLFLITVVRIMNRLMICSADSDETLHIRCQETNLLNHFTWRDTIHTNHFINFCQLNRVINFTSFHQTLNRLDSSLLYSVI